MTLTSGNAIVILGMHRSGTSALTGVLSLSGVDVGPLLIPAVAGINPKGFWEHAEVVDLHEQILATLDSRWDDDRPLPSLWWKLPSIASLRTNLLHVVKRDFSNSKLWVLKDPRICRLLPLWLEIFKDIHVTPNFVISLRHPLEVTNSLAKRDGLHIGRSSMLWLNHLLESEFWTRGFNRTLVTYEQLLSDWESVVRKISAGLCLELSSSEAEKQKIDTFLEPALRHHTAVDSHSSDCQITRLAIEAYQLCISTAEEHLAETLAPIAYALAPIVQLVEPWASQMQPLRARIIALERENAELKSVRDANLVLLAEVERVKSTVSWQITSPLRVTWNLFLSALGKKK